MELIDCYKLPKSTFCLEKPPCYKNKSSGESCFNVGEENVQNTQEFPVVVRSDICRVIFINDDYSARIKNVKIQILAILFLKRHLHL